MTLTLQDDISSSFKSGSNANSMEENDAEMELQWAAIERLPTLKRMKTSLLDNKLLNDGEGEEGNRVVDVTKLGALQRHAFIVKLITIIEDDNLRLLKKLKQRLARHACRKLQPCSFSFLFLLV